MSAKNDKYFEVSFQKKKLCFTRQAIKCGLKIFSVICRKQSAKVLRNWIESHQLENAIIIHNKVIMIVLSNESKC